MTIDLRLERETEYAEFSPGAAILNLGLHLPHDIGRVVKDLIAISDDKDLIIYDTDGKEVASRDIGTSIKELTFTGCKSIISLIISIVLLSVKSNKYQSSGKYCLVNSVKVDSFMLLLISWLATSFPSVS